MRRVTTLCLLIALVAYASPAARGGTGYRAGTAKVKITPEEPGYLLAYDRHQKAEGVEAELWTRALALEDAEGRRAVLVSADILGFPPSLARSIRRDARQQSQEFAISMVSLVFENLTKRFINFILKEFLAVGHLAENVIQAGDHEDPDHGAQ
jgi:hypothetical protein